MKTSLASRESPLAFTEHGVAMMASILNTDRAVEMSIHIVRAFVRMRGLAADHSQEFGYLRPVYTGFVTLLVLATLMPATFAAAAPGSLVRSFDRPVAGIAWTPGGRLLMFTDERVYEWPSGRSAVLHKASADGTGRTMFFEADSRAGMGFGPGFRIDYRTLESRPDAHRAAPTVPGWFVLGLSHNRRYALATKKPPFDGDTTYLLRLSPGAQRAEVLHGYPNASDDHDRLDTVDWSRSQRRFLVHVTNVASGITTPYFADSKLRPIRLPGEETIDSRLEWLGGTPWMLAMRRLMHENGNGAGYHFWRLDLWNYRTNELRPIAKVNARWQSEKDDPWNGPSLGPYASDPPGRRVAYTIATPTGGKVYVLGVRRVLAALHRATRRAPGASKLAREKRRQAFLTPKG